MCDEFNLILTLSILFLASNSVVENFLKWFARIKEPKITLQSFESLSESGEAGPCRVEEVFPKRKVGVRRAHCTLTVRPKARGLAQHGGPPGWLEESEPAGVILFVMDGPRRLPFLYRTGCPERSCPAASSWNFQLLLYSKCTQPSVMSYFTQGRHGLVL